MIHGKENFNEMQEENIMKILSAAMLSVSLLPVCRLFHTVILSAFSML